MPTNRGTGTIRNTVKRALAAAVVEVYGEDILTRDPNAQLGRSWDVILLRAALELHRTVQMGRLRLKAGRLTVAEAEKELKGE